MTVHYNFRPKTRQHNISRTLRYPADNEQATMNTSLRTSHGQRNEISRNNVDNVNRFTYQLVSRQLVAAH